MIADSHALIGSASIEAALARRDRLVAAALQLESLIGDSCYADDWFPRLTLRGVSRYDNDPWDLRKVVKVIDRNAWSSLISTPVVWSILDAQAREGYRQAWNDLDTVPEFTADSVESTMRRIFDERGDMMKRSVERVWQRLSPSHKTNAPNAFTRRVILRYVGSPWRYCKPSANPEVCDLLDDLDRILHKLRGLPEPDSRTRGAYRVVAQAINEGTERGPWIAQLPFFKVRIFQNGNGHLLFDHEHDLLRLNKVLSMNLPNALPNDRR